MSWIRSDKALLHHPKTAHLKVLLKVDLATIIGRLHMLWWWCLDYALDGDLSKHPPKIIEDACGIPIRDLMRAGFVDSRPRRRIHDWWDNQGNYLKLRFRDHPEKWMQIRDSYTSKSHMSTHMGNTVGKTVDVDLHTDVRTLHTDVRTYEEKKETRKTSALGASPRASFALTKVGDQDMEEFTRQDFLKVGWLKSEMPKNPFEWEHFEHGLTQQERVQSKLREKYYGGKS